MGPNLVQNLLLLCRLSLCAYGMCSALCMRMISSSFLKFTAYRRQNVCRPKEYLQGTVLPVWRADSHEQDTAIVPCDLHVWVLFSWLGSWRLFPNRCFFLGSRFGLLCCQPCLFLKGSWVGGNGRVANISIPSHITWFWMEWNYCLNCKCRKFI